MQKVPAQKQNLVAQWAGKSGPEGSWASDANAYCGSGLWPYSQLDDRPPEQTCVSTSLLSFQGTAPIESTWIPSSRPQRHMGSETRRRHKAEPSRIAPRVSAGATGKHAMSKSSLDSGWSQ